MAARNGPFMEVPAQAWELQIAALGGLTLSQLRFFIAFMLSVAAGAIFKHVPTPRGVPRKPRFNAGAGLPWLCAVGGWHVASLCLAATQSLPAHASHPNSQPATSSAW